jgi:hypothetical protein
MNRNRAELALLVLSAAVLAAGCVGSQQTGAAGSASASITAGKPVSMASATTSASPVVSTSTAPLRPSLSPADAAAVDRATSVIRALGGSVSPDANVSVSGLGPDGTPETVVALGAWLIEWDQSGRLAHVFVALPPYTSTPGGALSEAAARTRVADILARLGISLGAPTSIFYDDSNLDWRAHWDRVLDGFPVPSDGTMVIIQADGTFQSYGYSQAPNAPAPAHRISQVQAVAKAGRCRNIPSGPNGLVETCTAGLEWHMPGLAQGEGRLLRLCWRISFAWDDNDQNYGGGALWIDAGTGEVVDSTAIA